MSAGVEEGGALLSGIDRYEAGKERATLFNANASVADRQAQSEAAAGSYGETMVRMRGAATTGKQVAAIGASNLQQGGTPQQVVSTSAELNEMDALTTRNNALRKAWGYEVQAESDRLQAGFATRAGSAGAIESVLGGSAKAYTAAQEAGGWW